MTVSLPDEQVGQKILRCIADADGDNIDFTIHSVNDETGTPTTVLVGDITKKQWEAARLAVESGYYKQPREATLDDLAAELGISKSAVSQRLANLERTLVLNLIEASTESETRY